MWTTLDKPSICNSPTFWTIASKMQVGTFPGPRSFALAAAQPCSPV